MTLNPGCFLLSEGPGLSAVKAHCLYLYISWLNDIWDYKKKEKKKTISCTPASVIFVLSHGGSTIAAPGTMATALQLKCIKLYITCIHVHVKPSETLCSVFRQQINYQHQQTCLTAILSFYQKQFLSMTSLPCSISDTMCLKNGQ